MSASRLEVTNEGMRLAARLMAISWAAGWIIFGLISGIGEGLKIGSIALQATLPGIIIFITTIVALKWEGVGGILLVAEGFATTLYFLISSGFFIVGLPFIFFSSTLPAIVIGSLFIMCWKSGRQSSQAKLAA